MINTQENINANNLGTRVEVRESDLFSGVATDEKFDYIYFNPPFFEITQDMGFSKERYYNDSIALALGDLNFSTFDRFVTEVFDHLTDGGQALVAAVENIEGIRDTDFDTIEKLCHNKGFEMKLFGNVIPVFDPVSGINMGFAIYEVRKRIFTLEKTFNMFAKNS